MVSKKQIEAATCYMTEQNDMFAGDLVSDVVTAAWTRFDPENSTTWPQEQFAPSGMKWAQMYSDGIERGEFTGSMPNMIMWADCIAYADPADLMPVWGKT